MASKASGIGSTTVRSSFPLQLDALSRSMVLGTGIDIHMLTGGPAQEPGTLWDVSLVAPFTPVLW